jgi:hypothetical protein
VRRNIAFVLPLFSAIARTSLHDFTPAPKFKMDQPMLYVFNNTNGVKIIWNATVVAKQERRKTGFMSLLRTQFGG